MKTENLLERPFLTGIVKQNNLNNMFCVTDLVKIANAKRRELNKIDFNLSQYLKTKSVLEFIEELQNQYPAEKIISRKGKGAGSSTWVHPLLFIDIALSLDPKLKIGVYKWLNDELIRYRNHSGDSYKKMVGAIYERTNDKTRFGIIIQAVAKLIKTKLNVEDWNKATEQQLRDRDKIHENIVLLSSVLRDVKVIVNTSINNVLNKQ